MFEIGGARRLLVHMGEEQNRFLMLLGSPPARLTVEQTAWQPAAQRYLPENVAVALAQSVRPMTTLGELLETNHRDVLVAQNFGGHVEIMATDSCRNGTAAP